MHIYLLSDMEPAVLQPILSCLLQWEYVIHLKWYIATDVLYTAGRQTCFGEQCHQICK